MKTFNTPDMSSDDAMSSREGCYTAAAFSEEDPSVLWLGSDSLGVFRGQQMSAGAWTYNWERVYYPLSSSKKIVTDLHIDSFDSNQVWWATPMGVYMTTNDGSSFNGPVTDAIYVTDLELELLEPGYRNFLAGEGNNPSSYALLRDLDSYGGSAWEYTGLFSWYDVESIAFLPPRPGLASTARALVGSRDSSSGMVIMQSGPNGSWVVDSSVAPPDATLPGSPTYKKVTVPLGYDTDDILEAYSVVKDRLSGTDHDVGIFRSSAQTAGGSPGHVWTDITGSLDPLLPTSITLNPKDPNLLWATTRISGVFTLRSIDFIDSTAPSFPPLAELAIAGRSGNNLDFTWSAPGDDQDLPGWAHRYVLYYRTDSAISGSSDLSGASSVNLPAPHLAYFPEAYSLDVSAYSTTSFSIALVAYDEMDQSSELLIANTGIFASSDTGTGNTTGGGTTGGGTTSTGGGGGGCFIATAAYGSIVEPEVDALRHYRDGYLLHHWWGRALVNTYYAVSPGPARYIQSRPILRASARLLLSPIVHSVHLTEGKGFIPAAVGMLIVCLPMGALMLLIGGFVKTTIRRRRRYLPQRN